MQSDPSSVFDRSDTFFGVCQALGDDLGFNPLYLRLAIPLLLFLYPVATLSGYAAAGALVLLSRLLFPVPYSAIHSVEEGQASEQPATEGDEAGEKADLQLAA